MDINTQFIIETETDESHYPEANGLNTDSWE